MRGLRSMTQEEREFAEQHHNMVIDYLRCKHLPMDDFYDIVIFGYPSAVQQYFRNPPANVEFKAMAFRAMKDSVLRDTMIRVYEKMYQEKPKVEAIHAGLECGIFSGKIDGLDCISIGPNLYDVHSPKERLSISSVGRVYEFILEVLKELSKA